MEYLCSRVLGIIQQEELPLADFRCGFRDPPWSRWLPLNPRNPH